MPHIKMVNAVFPLNLEKVDFNATYDVPPNVRNHIEQMLLSAHVSMDTSADIDTYLNTIEIEARQRRYYVVLTKQMPSADLNGTILCMDSASGIFYRETAELKLFALYEINGKKLKPSYLKKLFNITSPEIELVDSSGNLRLTRLWHNGTFNAIEHIVLRFSMDKTDTISMERLPLPTYLK